MTTMTEYPPELVERVARALCGKAFADECPIDRQFDGNTDAWPEWRASALVALQASEHAELLEALGGAIDLLDDCEIAQPIKWHNVLVKHRGSNG